jgi:transketolase
MIRCCVFAVMAADRIDGHDHATVADTIRRAHNSDRPSLIAVPTIIAFGAPTKAGTAAAHGVPLGAAEIAGARERLGWNYPPFVIRENVRVEWRAAGETWRRRPPRLGNPLAISFRGTPR